MKDKRLIVVVPVFNEVDRIKGTINGLKSVDYIDEIVVVDDGSTDGTVEIVKGLDVSLILSSKNEGKGFAMKKGIEWGSYDYIGFIDGDLSTSSREIAKLVSPIVSGEVDFTIAKFPKPPYKEGYQNGFGLTKGLAKIGVYLYTGVKMDTSLSGQRIYKKEIMNCIDYIPNNYGVEVAMTIQALLSGFNFKEVPVDMYHKFSGRTFRGFMHRGRQFLNILKTLFIMLYRRWIDELYKYYYFFT